MFNIQYLIQCFVSGANCIEKGMIADFGTKKNVCYCCQVFNVIEKLTNIADSLTLSTN